MPPATAQPATLTIGRYEVRMAADQPVYAWEVIDGDGDVLDSFETATEAIKAAKLAEHEARVEELREAIEAKAGECECEATLAAVLMLLQRAK